jgi:hypothetical protein
VSAELRKAGDRDGYSRLLIAAVGNCGIIKRSFAPASFAHWNRPPHRAFSPRLHSEEEMMGKGLLLWLLGVPIPVILLLWLFFGR